MTLSFFKGSGTKKSPTVKRPTGPKVYDFDATHKMTGKHLKIGQTVYMVYNNKDFLSSMMGFAEQEIAYPGTLDKIHGVIYEVSELDGTYAVKWVSDSSGKEVSTQLKMAWFSDSELTTSRDEFLKGYKQFLSEVKTGLKLPPELEKMAKKVASYR